MTLRRKILGLISLALLLSIAVGSLLSYWHANKKVAIEMEAALAVGEFTVRNAVEPLTKYTEPAQHLQRIVASFNGNRHLQAFWVGPTGATVAESNLMRPDRPVPSWFFNIFGGAKRITTIPLPPDMKDLGHIQLATDSHSEVGEAWEDLSLKALIVGAFTISVLALVNSALSHALKPLHALADAFQRVGRGDYETNVPVTGPIELSSIYQSFNVMSAQLQDMELQNARLNAQLMSVQDEERAEIARDLHDEFGPFLFSIDVDARSIGNARHDRPEGDVSETANSIRGSVAHLQKHLRSMLGRLRPTALLDQGLAYALEQLVDFWSTRHASTKILLSVSQTSYGPKTDDVCYRVIQECLSNSIRHGKPREIHVTIAGIDHGRLRITVIDNGEGLKSPGRKGFGLAGMRDRISAVGGTIQMGNRVDGVGYSVIAEIPLDTDHITTTLANTEVASQPIRFN